MGTFGTSFVWTADLEERDSLALLPCRPHGFTHVLILGGSRAWRMRVAARCHRDGVLRRGPFVALTGESDGAHFHRALQCRLLGGPSPGFDDPFARSEGGTLFLDAVECLPPFTQRLLLTFLDRLTLATDDSPGAWAGRVVAGCATPPARGGAGRVLPPLFDALDKIRIEFSPSPPEALHEVPRRA